MTILRVGTNEAYSSGWDAAFGKSKKKSAGKTTAAKKNGPAKGKKKSAKVTSAKSKLSKTSSAKKKASTSKAKKIKK